MTVQPPGRVHEAALLTANGFCVAKDLVWIQAQGCQPGPHLRTDLPAELLESSPLLRARGHPGGSLGPVCCRLCGPQIIGGPCMRRGRLMEDRYVEARQLARPGSNSRQCQGFKCRRSKGTPSVAAYHTFSAFQHRGETTC